MNLYSKLKSQLTFIKLKKIFHIYSLLLFERKVPFLNLYQNRSQKARHGDVLITEFSFWLLFSYVFSFSYRTMKHAGKYCPLILIGNRGENLRLVMHLYILVFLYVVWEYF